MSQIFATLNKKGFTAGSLVNLAVLLLTAVGIWFTLVGDVNDLKKNDAKQDIEIADIRKMVGDRLEKVAETLSDQKAKITGIDTNVQWLVRNSTPPMRLPSSP